MTLGRSGGKANNDHDSVKEISCTRPAQKTVVDSYFPTLQFIRSTNIDFVVKSILMLPGFFMSFLKKAVYILSNLTL